MISNLIAYKTKLVKAIILTIVLLVANRPISSSAQPPVDSKTVPVVELTESGYARGLQHGTKLKKEIAEVFIKFKANIRNTTGRDADSVLAAFIAATNFEPITRQYSPTILDELKGIADGSRQPYQDVYAFQLIDEFWIYLDKQRNSTNHHCSSIGVAASKNSPAYIAQNIDLETYMHGYQVLFHLAATDLEPEQYIISCAGFVALAGMNSKGIGLCMNSVMELSASENGLPVAFLVRSVLSKQTASEALNMLTSVKHASGQNYILGAVDSVYDYEASATQVIRFLPHPEQTALVYHTNHAIVNHDVKPWYQFYHQQFLSGETASRNSEVRYATVKDRLKRSAAISTEVIKATLRSKDNAGNPVCRTYREGGGGFTFSSILFTLGGKRSIQLTYGSPDQSQYAEYFFKSLK